MSKNDNNEKKKIVVKSYNQSGGITAYNVNVGKLPRHLNQQFCDILDKVIAENIEREIKIITEMNDNESYQFGKKIYDYLISKGHKVPGGVGRMMASQPLQTRININSVMPVIEIFIGSQ